MNFVDIMCGSILMIFILFVLRFVVPIYSDIRLLNILLIIFYGIIGMIVYFTYSHYVKLSGRVFGKDLLKKLGILFQKKRTKKM